MPSWNHPITLKPSPFTNVIAVPIDLLLVDLSLPGGDGYELSKAILSVAPNVKVLFISGPAGAALCKFLGIDVTDLHFLQKPLAIPDLLNRVRSVLETAGQSSGLRSRSTGK